MRTETHITETRSIKKLLNVLPDYWVVRELTERDYGTDLLVEIFDRYGEACYIGFLLIDSYPYKSILNF